MGIDTLGRDIQAFLANDTHRAFDRAIAEFFGDAEFKEENVNRQPKGAPESAGGQFTSQETGAAAAEKPAKAKPVDRPPLKGNQGHPALISSRYPSGKGRTAAQAAAIAETKTRYNRADLAGMKLDPEKYEHNMRLLANAHYYPNLRPEETEGKTADEIATAAKNHAKANLRFLYEHAPPEVREKGHLWYEGAHNLAEEQAKQYGLPVQSVAAVYAALSPQKLWDMNVYLAERVLDIYTNAQNEPWSKTMEHAAQAKIAKAGIKAGATPESIARAKARKNAEFAAIRGKKLSELTDVKDKYLWIAIHDEARQYNEDGRKVNTLSFDRLSPDGKRLGTYLNKDGSKANAVWQTAPIGCHAIMAIESNGDRDIISTAMGGEHKVRSFYNNILDPTSENYDVTMDTHAVGAALLRPLGGTDVPVAHSLASEPKNGKKPADWVAAADSDVTGSGGTYGLWADAYRELAAELKPPIAPRVLQSITWEAKRRLFDEDMPKDVAPKIEALWQSYHRGAISLEQVQQQVLDLAGGMTGKRLSGTAAPKQEKKTGVRGKKHAGQQSGDSLDAQARDRDLAGSLHRHQLGRDPGPVDGRGRDADPRRAAGLDPSHAALDRAITQFFAVRDGALDGP